MRRGPLSLMWLGLAATAWPALRGEDRVAADAIWRAAEEEAPGDFTARIWVDAARVNASVAPWQEGYAIARARIREVAEGRRAALAHDRGARRMPVELP